ncbi:MAG: PspC domain-containing protein [Prevotella sp.]|nr:PspC domain-containing protein [Prevotella sp.]
MEQKRYHLSQTDKKLGGVCGGLAEYFDVDPLLVRIAFIILFLGYGSGLLVYILLWLLAPKNHMP